MKIYAIYQCEYDGDGYDWWCIKEDMIYLNREKAQQKLEELENKVKSSLHKYISEQYSLETLEVIE